MTIQEMHAVFRTLGQQMGMQTIRAIIPESIDIYINDAIIEKVRTELYASTQTSTTLNSDVQASRMANINALGTLYSKCDLTTTDEEDIQHSFDCSLKTDIMMIFAISIGYDNGKSVACRLLGSDVLETTLNDYCNSASKDYPIACIIGNTIDVFTGDKVKISNANIKYIKNPAVVDFNKRVNCDLPQYLHYEIVENAVRKFYMSVSNSIPQQQKD